MKAFVSDRPGDMRLEDVDQPTVPHDGVLVRVYASAVNPVDLFPTSRAGYTMRRFGREPKRAVLGTDFAGIVESVGKSVSRFHPGDRVFGAKRGAFAEYLCVPESGPVAMLPANISFEQAAAVPIAAATALQAVRDHGHVQPGQKVLINGASGGVGTFAVQIAKAFGAEVTGVCSPSNVEKARSLGADHIIDYTAEDFTRNGLRYDVLLDIAGSHSLSECRRVLERNATYVLVGASAIQHSSSWRALSRFATVRFESIGASQRVAMYITKMTQSDLEVLRDLLVAGKVTSVIDRCYELSDVSEAFRYFEEGHAKGKIVVSGMA